jgi:hypothetical protein
MRPQLQMAKDPEAVIDVAFDWATNWLAAAETISTYTVTVPAGLTLASHTSAAGVVTAWISGGTAETTYRVECKIVTSAGRTDERSIEVRVTER